MTNKPLQTPDPVALASTQTLCSWSKPYQRPPNYELLFVTAMREILQWHQKNSPFYARLLAQEKFNPQTWDGNPHSIPWIAADFFKQHEVKSVADKDISLHLTSSGTTGQKSQIFFDSWSIGSAQQMVDFIFSNYGWISSTPVNYLLYSYQTEADSKLGTSFTDNFLTKYAPVNQVVFALKWNGRQGHDFDLYGCIRALQDFSEQGLPVRIFGFPAFFYFTLERMKAVGIGALQLSPESLVFLGGGWKGHADKAIEKKTFYAQAESQLGIPGARLRDGFGSVEHCIPYIECSQHHFHIPIYSQVIIRDLRNLKPLSYHQPGFLQFVSPYITSVPAHSVLMGDLATKYPGKDCSCGLGTDWFEIQGRAGVSKNKSCAVAAAELLKNF